ncbi:MAG: diaminobutyrate--2-oxoglutarate transaminase, partial [Alphaproteobacteria bacterium]
MTTDNPSMRVFDQYESNVRAYCRSFPTVFESARGHLLTDQAGRRYIDFFAGAGALNYGHNPPPMKRALIDYLTRDGITHSLDMATSAKAAFIETFQSVILQPRNMDHKLLFPGPTGTNSVESALKLARKVTGRSGIISFTNAFHGMTLGALAVTGNAFKRGGAGVGLSDGTVMPYDGYFGEDDDTLNWLATMLDDQGSGVDLPAAVIVETIQGEGGLAAARFDWLKNLETLCGDRGMLLIVDDVQAGCGRTGPFFSFEPAGINPDII